MGWLSGTSLTLEQRQRREAMREARHIINETRPDSDEVIEVAEYILRGEVPPPRDREEG